MLKPWKRRWCFIENDELVQTYDPASTKRLEVISLKGTGTVVKNRPGGYVGLEVQYGEKHYPYCFTVYATKWTKKGVFVFCSGAIPVLSCEQREAAH